MAKRVQIIRHSTSGANAFVGEVGEVTMDTTKYELRLHDGVTPGGTASARADLSNTTPATVSVLGHMTPAQVAELADLRVDLTSVEAVVTALDVITDSLQDLAFLDQVNTLQIVDLAVTTGKIAALAVTAAKLASDAVETAKIAANAVTTAKMLDANVTNAKLANMAAATIKGSVAGGVPADLTATQVTALLNNMGGDSGSGGLKGLVPAQASGDTAKGYFLGAAGTWGRPGLIQLATLTVGAAVSTVSFTDIPAYYSRLFVAFTGVSPSADDVGLGYLVSNNNGSAYLSSGYTGMEVNNEGFVANDNGSRLLIRSGINNGATVQGFVKIEQYAKVVPKPTFTGALTSGNAGSTVSGMLTGGSLAAINALRFAFGSGNIDAGTFTLYGE